LIKPANHVVGGSSYVLGKTNADHWYLYVAGEQLVPLDLVTICPETKRIVTPTTASHANLAALTAHGTDPPDLLACCGAALSNPSPRSASRASSRGNSPGIDEARSSSGASISSIGSCSVCSSTIVEDRTLEILMTGLDQELMKKYFMNGRLGNGSKNEVESATGLDKLIPGCLSDSYLFDPCGWSQNGLIGPYYTTFHVTPEEECSYASFETNIPLVDQESELLDGLDVDHPCALPALNLARLDGALTYKEMIKRVLNVFCPTNVTLTHFSNAIGVSPSPIPPTLPIVQIDGYRLIDISVNVLPHYHLFYCHYVREGCGAGVARQRHHRKRVDVVSATSLG
jgi:S-adenosylmethionine decarboxylase